jgi:hypothetical protein
MIGRSGDRSGQGGGGGWSGQGTCQREKGAYGDWMAHGGGLGDRSIVDAMRSYRVHNSVAWYGNAPEGGFTCIDRWYV